MSIKDILNKAKELVGCDENVKIVTRPLKTTPATVSLSRKVITIDPRVMNLDENLILFILVHELVHLKLGTIYHTKSFWNEIEKVFGKELTQDYDEEVIKSFTAITH